MSRFREIAWPRIFAEGAAIVVSILLAFSIEAWWSERQDKDDERALLSSLLEEFQELKLEVDWRRKYEEGIRNACRQLIQASLAQRDESDDQFIDRHLTALWYNQELAPYALPVLSSAISSGELALISNSAVRRRIALWPERLERVRNTMQRDLDFFSDRLMPFLSASVSLPQVLAVEDHIPGHPNEIYQDEFTVKIENPISHQHLLSNLEFQNLLVEREVLITDILYLGLRRIDQELDATIEQIGAELGD